MTLFDLDVEGPIAEEVRWPVVHVDPAHGMAVDTERGAAIRRDFFMIFFVSC